MRINKLLLFLFITFSFVSKDIFATHIIGGTMEYIRLGPGSMPNSSRYKIKLILYRDKGGVQLSNQAMIYVRGDARYPFNSLVESNPTTAAQLTARFGNGNAFARDFAILPGSPVDTLTVRPQALTEVNDVTSTTSNHYFTGWSGEYALQGNLSLRFPNTSIAGVSTIPGYEYSAYNNIYPAKQFMADRSTPDGITGFGWVRQYDVTDNSSLVDTCTEVISNTFEVKEYTRVVDLPNIPGGYHVFSEISARNGAVLNVRSPGAVGFTVYTRIPDIALLDTDADSFTKLYNAYSAAGMVTTLGTGSAFSFAGSLAGVGQMGGYLNDRIRTSSITGVIKDMQASSPRFISRPPSFVCGTDPVLFKTLGKNPNNSANLFQAFDYDGDRLEYEVVSASAVKIDAGTGSGRDYPFTGTWKMPNATVDGASFIGTDRLYPTMPYTNLVYPYSVNIATFKPVQYQTFAGASFVSAEFPMGLVDSVPGIVIDKNTGKTTLTPLFDVSSGDKRVVTSIRVREFRNVTVPGSALSPSVPGAGFFVREALMGQINIDYQFLVKKCPLPSLAFMAPTIGCFKPNSSNIQFTYVPNSTPDPINNLYWDFGRDRYTVTGIKNPTDPLLSTEVVRRVAPNGSIVNTAANGGVSDPTFFGIGKTPTYSFPGVGSYFVKLVVQLNSDNRTRNSCSDSAFSLVNVSVLRSGYTVTGGPICINIPIDFNPFATGSATGFTTTSGSSLYTNINTNPIPLIVKRRRDSAGIVLYTYLGAGFWMQPNGTRDTIAPDASIIAPSKILNVKYGFGNGATQTFTRTLSTNAWVASTSVIGVNFTITGPFPQIIPNTRVTVTGLAGPLNNSIPGIRYAYPDSITNAISYLIVKNQFGCSDSVSRNVTVVKNYPTARIITPNVCENVTTLTVQGFTTTANKGIWSGLGTFLPIPSDNFSSGNIVTATGVTTILGGTAGFVINSIYQPTMAELSVVGLNPFNTFTTVVLSTTGIPECPTAISTVAGIQVFQKPFVDAGPATVLLCKNNLQYKLNATITGARTPALGDKYTGVWSVLSGMGVFSSTGTNSSTVLDDGFSFPSSVTSVVLQLSAINIGSCLPVSDVITLAGGNQPLPLVNAANNFTVNGIRNALNICANNATFTITGTVTYAGLGGQWTSLSASPGTGTNILPLTTIPGVEAFKVSYIYTPSAQEIANGFADLQLSTDIINSPTNCLNATRAVRIIIGAQPVILFDTKSPVGNSSNVLACSNNPIFTISGTVLGAGGFTLNVGNGGILSQLSTLAGTTTISGYNNYFSGNYSYTPTAAETSIAGFSSFLASFQSTNNGNCFGVSTSIGLNLNPPPSATITTTGIVLDSIKLCNNNAFANLSTKTSLFTPVSGLRWFTSGNGGFSNASASATTTYTSSQNDTLNGNVRIVLEAGRSGCFPTYDTLYIKYFNSPIIAPGSDLSICENFLVGTLSGAVSLPASGGIWSSSGAGVFGSTSSSTTTKLNDTYIPNATDVSNSSIILTLSSTGANIGTTQGKCLSRAASIIANFTPVPAINFGAVLTVNENNSTSDFTATIIGINVTPTTTAIWGTDNNNVAAYDPSRTNFIYNSGIPNLVGSVKYTPTVFEINSRSVIMGVTVSGASNCAPIVNSTTLLIAPAPTVSIFGINSVCANNNTINLTSTVTGAKSGIWSGGQNAITAPYPGFSATYVPNSAENIAGSVKLYFTSAEEFFNANSVRDSITININPPPTAKITAANVSVCGNATDVPFTATTTGATGMVWTTSGSGQFFIGASPISGSVPGSNITVIYKPSALDRSSATPIKIEVSSAGNGGCNPAIDIANLYFTTSPVANAGPDNTWCLNDPSPIALNASGGAGSWSSSRPGGSFGNATQQSTSYAPTSVSGLITFTWTTNATTGCPSVSDNAVVTVLSGPIIAITEPYKTVCGNSSSLALNATITGGTGAKWRTGASGGSFSSSGTQNGADLVGTTVATGNAVADTYIFSAADKAAGFVNLTISGLGTNPCTTVQEVKRITITPILTASTDPDLELCATISVISITGKVLANGVIDATRNGTWTVVGTGMGTFANPNTRITTFTPSANAKNNFPQKVTLIFSPTIDGSCFVTRPTVTVNYSFKSAPLLTITSSPIQVCSDVDLIQLTATFSGTSSIVWSTTGSNTALNWVASKNSLLSPATVNYIPSAADLANPTLSFVVITNGSGVCSDVSSPVFVATITSKPTVVLAGPSSVCDNVSQVSLSGTNMTLLGVSPAISWYKYTGGVPTSAGFNLPSTITTNNVGTLTTYSPTAIEKSNGFVTLFLDVFGPTTCKTQSFSKIVNFNAAPTVFVGAASSNVCSNIQAITLTGTSSPNASIAGWSSTAVGLGFGTFSVPNSYTVIFTPNAAGRTLSGIDFVFTTSLAGCSDVSANKTITLTPASVVSIPSTFAFCGDKSVVTLTGAFSSTNVANMSSSFGGTFGASYQPIVYAPPIANIDNAAKNATAITLTITSANNGSNCSAASAVSSIFFTPRPTITGGAGLTLCASDTYITLSSATGVSGSAAILGYKWSTSSINTAVGLGGIFTFSGLSTSTGLSQVYRPGSVEKTGFAILRISSVTVSGGCDNVFADKQITYDKAPTFASLPNQTKCANNSILDINVNPNDFSSIKWSSNTSKLPSGGAFLSEVATATTYFPGTLDLNTKTVTISGTVLGIGQCINNPAVQSFVLSITSAPIITVISPLNICSEVSTVQLSAIANISTTGLSWQNTTSSISGVYSVNRFVGRPIYAVTATDVSNGTIQFEVTGNYGNCGPVSEAVQLNIAPKPTINAGSDRVLCADVTQSSIKLTFAGQNFTKGQWVRLGGAGGGNFGNPIIDQAAIAPSSNGDQDFVYYYPNSQDSVQKIINLKVNTVDQNGLCGVASDIVNITLVSPPVITPGVGTNYCETLQVITLTGSVVGPETYTYQWQGLFGNQNGTFLGSNGSNGIGKTYAGSANDFYNTGDLDEDKYVFNFNVTGTGICKFESIGAYKMTFNIQPITQTSIVEGDFNVCADADEITITGLAQYANLIPQGLIPTFIGKNFNGIASGAAQYQPSKSPPHIYDGNLGGFKTQLRYRIFQNDITAGGVNFVLNVNNLTNSTTCPPTSAISNVTLLSAPIVSVTGPPSACSNNVVITVSGFSSTGAGTWSSTTAVANRGKFLSVFTIAGSPNIIAGVYSISGDEFDNKFVSLLFKSESNGLCKQVSGAIVIPLKEKPIVDAGVDGTVCNLNVLSLTGTITNPLTASGVAYGWRIVSMNSVLGAALATITGSGFPSSNIIFNSVTGVDLQLVSTVFNPNGALGDNKVTFELSATDATCNVVAKQISYTVTGATSLNAGSLVSTICGSDPLKMNPSSSSEKGVWSTSGAGYFASGGFGAKTSQIMNDLYIPGPGENGTILFILSTIPGSTNTCLVKTPSTVTAFLSNGIDVNSGSSQFINICYNYNPIMAGTILGTSKAHWRSTGTGTFASCTTLPCTSVNETGIRSSNSQVVSTITGTITGTGYVFEDVYIPSDNDKVAGNKVIVYLTSDDDAVTQCKFFKRDSLSIYFTKPPEATGGRDITVCATDAIANGIPISGIVTMPSPNSNKSGQLPNNAARWKIMTISPGSPLSSIPGVFNSSVLIGNAVNTATGIGEFTVTSIIGDGFIGVEFDVSDRYFPSILDTISSGKPGYRPLYLALEADNMTIAGINTVTSTPILCNAVIDTVKINFLTPAYAQVTNFTSTGICSDQQEIAINGIYSRASGLLWTTTGGGIITSNRFDNSQITYTLSQNELDIDQVKVIKFSPIPIPDPNDAVVCVSPITNVVTVTVNPRPLVSVTGLDQIVCADNQSVALLGFNIRTVSGTLPLAYKWIIGGSGTVLGPDFASGSITETNNFTRTLNYRVSNDDIAAGSVGFLFSTSGPNTCKPQVINNISLNINPAPVINPQLSIERCRDNELIPISLLSIQNVSTVQWVVSRRAIGSSTFTVLGIGSNPGTLAGGSLAQSVNGTLVGDNFNGSAIDYFTSATDRASAAELVFSVTSLINNPNTSNPVCNQVVKQVSVVLTDTPVVTITSALAGGGICSNETSITLNGSISGAGNLSGIWLTDRFGRFFPSEVVTPTDLAANAYQYFLDDQDRNFTTLGITLSVTGVGTCVRSYGSTSVITVTAAPELNAGGNDSVCADLKSITLLNSAQKNADAIFQWITFGTGSFTGISTTSPGEYFYIPSSVDSANGAVTIALIVPNKVTCNPDTSFKTIRFSVPPKVEAINSVLSSQSWCADNTVLFEAFIDSRASKWRWSSIKSIVGFNQFFASSVPGFGVRGVFNNDNNDTSSTTLKGYYKPSNEDTLGTNRNELNQLVTLRLTANGVGVCALRTFTSDLNVTFTPQPKIYLNPIPNICKNDNQPITLTAYFLNTVAGRINWQSDPTTSTKFSNEYSYHPPTTVNSIYFYDDADKNRGVVKINILPDFMGSCKGSYRQGDWTSRDAKFIDGPIFSPSNPTPFCADVTTITLDRIRVNTVVGSAQWTTKVGTGIFTSSNTIPGLSTIVGLIGGAGSERRTVLEGYVPSAADKAQKQVNLFVYSTSQTENCPPDSAKITLKFDDIPIVTVAVDGSSVCAGQIITLTSTLKNHNRGIWETISNSAGVGTGSITPASSTVGTVFYTMSPQDANQSAGSLSQLSFKFTSIAENGNKCTPKGDTATINIYKKPTANAGFPSVCTISGIKLAAIVAFSTQSVWTTTGKGIFSPSKFDANATYVPDAADIALGNVKLSLTAKGLGPCDETTSSIQLNLKANPLPLANAGQDQIVCGGDLFRLNVVNLSTANSYQWLVPSVTGFNTTVLSPLADRNITAVTVRVDNLAKYVLQVTDNSLGCINTDTINLQSLFLDSLAMKPRVCFEDQLILSVGASFTKREGKFQWYRNGQFLSNESTPTRIRAIVTGDYTLEYTENGTLCSVRDTTNVRPLPFLNTIGKVVCKDAPFSLTPGVLSVVGADINFYNYTWDLSYNYAENIERFKPTSDKDSLRVRTLRGLALNRDSAKYLVQVIDPAFGLNCNAYDTARVKTHPVPDMTLKDVYACEGDVVKLDATPSNIQNPKYFRYPPSPKIDTVRAGYSWTTIPQLGLLESTQVFNPKIWLTTVNGNGLYIGKFIIGECAKLDSSLVTFNAKPIVTNEPEVPYCVDEKKGILLDAGVAADTNNTTLRYLWLASGNTGKTELVYDTAKYYVRISNVKGCAYIDSITVRPSCDPQVFIPEGFIPDGEVNRDKFFTVFGKYFDDIEFTVFNRWGEIVYVSKDKDFMLNNGWDGKFGTSKLPFGVYPYIFKYRGLYKEQRDRQYEKRGSITIIR